MNYATHLECRKCKAKYPLNYVDYPCGRCGGILDTQYDYERMKSELQRRSIESIPLQSMWKYKHLLPVNDRSPIISLSEGGTPLIKCKRLGERLGLKEVYVKDEGRNPTGTFKARGASLAITKAYELGVKSLGAATIGNAGHAIAAYCAAAGIECHIFMPEDCEEGTLPLMRALGADVKVLKAPLAEVFALAELTIKQNGWYSLLKTPFRHEGKKTMGFEIAEQLGWRGPNRIFYPVGGGFGFIGIWKGFLELQRLGWLEGDLPHMYATQSTGCAPIKKAFEQNRRELEPWRNPSTVALGVGHPNPFYGPWILDAIYESHGGAEVVTDQEILDAALLLAKTEGIEAIATGAVPVAAVKKMADEGRLDRDELIVILVSGSGLKTWGLLEKYMISRRV